MKLLHITAAALVLALAGCTGLGQLSAPAAKPLLSKGSPAESFAALEAADIDQATAVATTNNDLEAMQCNPMLKKYVLQCQGAVVAPVPAMPIARPTSTDCKFACDIEVLRVNNARIAAAGRSVVSGFTSKVQCWTALIASPPRDLHMACAPLWTDPLNVLTNFADQAQAAAPAGVMK